MMEEVDQIILNQLNNIGCDLDNEITSLNELDNHDLVNAFIRCVLLIDTKLMPNCKFSANMNITDKYRINTDLANAIKSLGYRAEIGYQTFLYFNEKESRRLFLFLFDKLSKQKQEEPKNINRGLLNRLKNVKIDLNCSRPIVNGISECDWKTDDVQYLNYFMKNDSNDCVPFDNTSLFIEWNTLNLNSNSKLFANFYQNSKLNLNRQTVGDLNSWRFDKKSNELAMSEMSMVARSEEITVDKKENSDEQIKNLKEQLDQLQQELESNRERLKTKSNALKSKREKLEILNQSFDEKKSNMDRLKYSNTSNEELNEGIRKLKDEINEVNKRWQLFNLKYDETMNELKAKKNAIINKFSELNEEIMSTKNKIEVSTEKLKKIEEQTIELNQNLDNNDNLMDRKFYTKRIFEIINNVKKQEQDIDKILGDIRNSQREINQLSGKVTRTCTVVEETVLKNSNLNDWSKRCYRLIIELDELYDRLINEIESSGQIEREILKFEEMLENEKSNKIGSNLAKVTYDLEQIRKNKSHTK